MTERRDGTTRPEGIGHRVLTSLLSDDRGRLDDWSREFLRELEAEGHRAPRGGWRARAGGLRRLLSPTTIQFVRLMRRRRRKESKETMRMKTLGRFEEGWRSSFRDLRHAARGLVREPRFVFFIALTLAVGIGANAAMFSVADRLFLSGPAHVEHPEDLVRLYLRFPPPQERTAPWIPWRAAEHLRESTTAFSHLSAYRVGDQLVRIGGSTRPLSVSAVAENYFQTLGVGPAAGRFFSDGEGAPPAVIGHHLWMSEFGGSRSVLGRQIQMPGQTFTVVGIAPQGFTGPDLGRVDVWVPIDESQAPWRNWRLIGRLRSDLRGPEGIRQAGADADSVFHETLDDAPRWSRTGAFVAGPLSFDDAATEPSEILISRLLMGMVALVLLIACLNVTSLLVTRIATRRREVVVRLALGAGRWRLMRLLFAESSLLSILGAFAALPVAYWTGTLLRGILLPQVEWISTPLNTPALAMVGLTAVGVAAAIGLLPAIRAGRCDLAAGLRSFSASDSGRGRKHWQTWMSVAQMALSAALLLCAGLFLKSFQMLRTTDLGVEPSGTLMATLRSFSPGDLASGSEQERRVYKRALDAVRSQWRDIPAALSVGLPFIYNFTEDIFIPGRQAIPSMPGGGPFISTVGEGYFEAVGTPILRGRPISHADVLNAEPVAVVSHAMADLLWPKQDAVGQCLRAGSESSPCLEVIGVAADVHRVGYREPPSMQFYIPLGKESGFSGMALAARPPAGAGATEALRAMLEEIDPAVEDVQVRTLQSLLDPQSRPWRLGATVLGISAVLALLVSVAGVYGVLSHLVAQRRREVGVRMALGASRGAILRLIVGRGASSALLGSVLGAALVLSAESWLQPLLFETRVLDPVVLSVAAAILLGSALLASLLPARRAARLDPVRCLKAE